MKPSDVFDVFINEPSYYVTYSYKEGVSNILQIITAVSIFALISMIISLIIGIRKKDCLAILVANIMVKTVATFIYQILYDLLYLDDFFSVILFATIVIEGFIYTKVLKYKKHNGMTVSVICNIGIVAITILMLFIPGSGFRILMNLLL